MATHENTEDAPTPLKILYQDDFLVAIDKPSGRLVHRTNLDTREKHQLRRHLAHIRHPILGDTSHGDGAQNRFLREYCNCHRLMLRATRMELPHPIGGEGLAINADLEAEFDRVLGKLELI